MGTKNDAIQPMKSPLIPRAVMKHSGISQRRLRAAGERSRQAEEFTGKVQSFID